MVKFGHVSWLIKENYQKQQHSSMISGMHEMDVYVMHVFDVAPTVCVVPRDVKN